MPGIFLMGFIGMVRNEQILGNPHPVSLGYSHERIAEKLGVLESPVVPGVGGKLSDGVESFTAYPSSRAGGGYFAALSINFKNGLSEANKAAVEKAITELTTPKKKS